MSRRFWVADLHLGHPKVAEIRGYEETFSHDARIMDQLFSTSRDDVVWVLGDISSGKPEHEERALNLLREVPAQLHLIAGNHDSVSSIHRQGYKKQREWLEVFDSIQQFGRIKLGGHHILMSHYPYARSGDGPGREGSRYAEFRLPDVGAPLIHGHTHQTTPHMGVNDTAYLMGLPVDLTDRQQYCVSWDVHRRLVTEKDLNDWIGGLE